jgi:DNA-binding beta-propeller fold protein YncE
MRTITSSIFPLLVLAVVVTTPAVADEDETAHQLSGPVAVLWDDRDEGSGADDGARAMALSPDGSTVVVTGVRDNQCSTLAYDGATGALVWSARYGDSGPAAANAVAISPDGATAFVTGWAYTMHVGPFQTRETPTTATGDSTLAEVWERRPPYGQVQTRDFATIAYDTTTGERLWDRRYPDVFGNDVARAIAVSPDGTKVFVAGQSNHDYATVAYDAFTGQQLWQRIYDGPDMWMDSGEAITVSPDGSRVLVTGSSRDWDTGWDWATLAYDPETGDVLWESRYQPAQEDEARAIVTSADGATVFVAGISGADYALMAYNTVDGTERCDARHPSESADEPRAIAVRQDGAAIYLTGHSGDDCVTIAYDSDTCEELWLVRHPNGDGSAVALTPGDTRIVITGDMQGPSGSLDYGTMALDPANRETIWSADYDGPVGRTDRAVAIAPGPKGKIVYVTGRSDGDTVTMAYLNGFLTAIDIRPGGPNTVFPNSWQPIAVAVLGGERLDVTEIDVTSLRFGPAGAEPRHDLSDPFIFNGHIRDANLDGYPDLVVHFTAQATGIECGDTTATLCGACNDCVPFEGMDSIVTRGCGGPGDPAESPIAIPPQDPIHLTGD